MPAASPIGSRELSLRLNFSWTLAGNVVYAASQWAVLVALAKLGSPQHVGVFAFGLAVGAPIILFSQLHLRAMQATDATQQYSFGTYLTLRLLTTPAALLAIAAMALAGGYGPATAATLVLIGIMKAADAVSDVYFGAWQRCEQMKGIAIAQVLNGIGSLLFLSIALALTGSVVWAAAGAVLGSLGSLAFVLRHDRALRRDSSLAMGEAAWNADLRTLLQLAGTALPLGVVMLLISLNGSIPRYVIQHKLGESELGIFAAVTYLMMAGVTVVNALGQSASPRLARYHASGDPRFGRLVWLLVGIGAAIGLAGVLGAYLAGGWLLATMYTPAYAGAATLLVWTMAAAAIYYVGSFLGYAITAARQLKPQVPLSLAVTLVIAATGPACVDRWGLVGAMWSYGLAMTIQLLGSALILAYACRPSSFERFVLRPVATRRPFVSGR